MILKKYKKKKNHNVKMKCLKKINIWEKNAYYLKVRRSKKFNFLKNKIEDANNFKDVYLYMSLI